MLFNPLNSFKILEIKEVLGVNADNRKYAIEVRLQYGPISKLMSKKDSQLTSR